MEDERLKHVCKFCKKRFACGRSLGGHIRCHLPKPGYKLRENPRKTWRVESLPSAAASLLSSSSPSSDETDQTEKIKTKGSKWSSINNSHSSFSEVVEEEEEEERHEEEDDDDEESDVAFCLIMLSRDAGPWGKKVINNKRKRKVKKVEGDDDVTVVNVAENQTEMRLESGKNISSDDKSYCGNNNNNNTKRGGKNFECTTCNKVFHSYQALGGHKASHRRGVSSVWNSSVSEQNSSLEKGRVFTDISLGTCPKVSNKIVQQKHECPFCFRVFGTGQALGGHKRSHLLGSGGSSSSETRDTIIELDLDLNLPPKQARDESTGNGNGNGNGNGIAAASSSSSLVGLIKPYWWVEDHNKNEPFLSLVPN